MAFRGFRVKVLFLGGREGGGGVRRFRVYGAYPKVYIITMENQVEKKMENDMETPNQGLGFKV